ncbi:MAG: gfo/Idh/MocA family oxidoreductase [Planctomycetota bacterium]|nr:MAG: gfo/Idh/MocA family oxidoreductase [Planctomycetota bacterium]
MSHEHSSAASSAPSRRDFLKTSSAAVAGAAAANLLVARSAHAAGSDILKIGLIGCGGRGTGAVGNAFAADKQTQLVAVADAFEDRAQNSIVQLQKSFASRVDVPPERFFVGFDAYEKLLATDCDVVILATPPHFRPAHLKAAINSGKHVFCEKPVAVDAPGVRSVLETTEQAKAKNLTLVSGLCYRYDPPKVELMKRVHDGAIGDIQAMHVSYNTGTLWHHGRDPNWSEMEFQLRNWLYFTWLSGDFNVEQHIHSLDKASWAMNDQPPVKATGLGGRQVRTDDKWGNIYDHFSVIYEYENGTRLFANCRQMAGCSVDVSDHLFGTKGTAEMMRAKIEGENPWRYRGDKPSMYEEEHRAMFGAIRSGNPINNGLYMANSTMLAIMGRMAAYTGQTLTWDQCINSSEDLSPESYEWGEVSINPVAMPGLTRFA